MAWRCSRVVLTRVCPVLPFGRSIPTGLEDVSRYPYLFAELLRDTSWSVLDLQKLAGLNLIRAFREVEEVSSAAHAVARLLSREVTAVATD